MGEQAPEELQTWPAQLPGPVQAMHCHCPLLQMGLGNAQSELEEHPTQAP